MSDLSITAANVAKGANAKTADGIAGESITAGQTIYRDASDNNKLKKADANASLATSQVIGIALHAADSGQPLKYQTIGDITIGATVAVGTIYVQSGTAGKIAPAADLASTWYTFIIGIGKTSSVIQMIMKTAGVQVP